MIDQEPHRSVQLIRRIDSRIPSSLLSSVASASTVPAVSLGKLAPLRAPVAQRAMPPAFSRPSHTPPAAASSSSAAAGRDWTAVVSRPTSSRPTPVPSPTAWLTESKRPTTAVSSGAVVASKVPPPAAAHVSADDVPDDWEDEA